MILLPIGAVVADWIIGDPQGWPHPVNLIGALIRRWDKAISRRGRDETSRRARRLLGALGLVGTAVLSATLAAAFVLAAGLIARPLEPLAALVLLTYGLAARCLVNECGAVAHKLDHGTIEEGRTQIARLVGRDTSQLTHKEIAAAAVETLAENASDGAVAPLFWASIGAALGGAAAACAALWAYKAINTCDSLVGYRTERHEDVGRWSARADDLVNLIPARLTALLFCLVAPFAGLNGREALRIWRRDGNAHLSPNAGHPEAAMAGALGVQLGGSHVYFGRMVDKPTLGDNRNPITAHTVRAACRMMMPTLAAALLILAPLWAVRS